MTGRTNADADRNVRAACFLALAVASALGLGANLAGAVRRTLPGQAEGIAPREEALGKSPMSSIKESLRKSPSTAFKIGGLSKSALGSDGL